MALSAVTLVAGCVAGPSPAASAGPSPSVAVVTPASAPSPEPAGPPSASPSPPPSPTASPAVASGDPAASPNLPHADADLERYVPDRIGTVDLLRWSLAGPDVPPAGGDMCLLLCGNEPREFASALGIPLDRITVAMAMGEQGGIGGVAFRAKDVATERLAAAGVAITGGVVGGGGPSFPMTVDGRKVTYLYRLGRGQYLIPSGDVLVFLYGEPPMTAPGQISPKGTVPPDVVTLIDALPR